MPPRKSENSLAKSVQLAAGPFHYPPKSANLQRRIVYLFESYYTNYVSTYFVAFRPANFTNRQASEHVVRSP